jgi:hypothetical protein
MPDRLQKLLILTGHHVDELALRLACQQLLMQSTIACWLETAALEPGESVDAQVAEAMLSENYRAVYVLEGEALFLRAGMALERGDAAGFRYTTVIARPENAAALLRAQARRQDDTQLDLLQLAAGKNEWIEAGFAAAQLARTADSARSLVLLPGKNYQLEDDTELFEATLANGCVVQASDLRGYYFLRGQICWESANFTPQQLDEAAKLPAALTPLYVHGNGDVTLPYAGEAGGEHVLQHRDSCLLVGGEGATLVVKDAGFARVHLPSGSAHAALGKPQPGDALSLKPLAARLSQAA